MRHPDIHDLFGFTCDRCWKERSEEGAIGLYMGCTSCKAPFQYDKESNVLLVASSIPGFYELLCEVCGRGVIEKEMADG